MDDVEMTLVRDLSQPVAEVNFPKSYALINVTENCRHLWEQFMDACFGGYQPGSFRWVYVGNYYYEEDRVFVLLNENNQPIATGNSWQNLQRDGCIGYISWIGVLEAYRGKQLGYHMTNYCLHDIKRRGFQKAIITTEKNNHPALKTYMKCGFVPHITSEEDIQHWADVYSDFGISTPIYDKTIHPDEDIPHPSRPWPYQLARERAAIENGDLFLHGRWNRFNMYHVDKAEWNKLKQSPLMCDCSKWLDENANIEDGNIYVDSDINPRAALMVTSEKEIFPLGISKEGCFEDGVILFLRELKR